MKLTPEQIEEIKSEMVSGKEATICRFLHNGETLNITTGQLTPAYVNVMYKPHYWNFTKETANKIAGWLGVKVEFCE